MTQKIFLDVKKLLIKIRTGHLPNFKCPVRVHFSTRHSYSPPPRKQIEPEQADDVGIGASLELGRLGFGAFRSAALDGNARINQSLFMYRIIGADGREYGPISADQLRQWIGEGRANATTHVLPEGAPEWKPLGSLPEFSMLFGAPAQSPLPPTPFSAPAVLPSHTVSGPRTNGLALTGFIFGLVSFPFCLMCCCFGPVFNILGIVFSLVGLSQINRRPEDYTGKVFAVIGLILSILCLVLYFILMALGIGSSMWSDGISHHARRL